MLTVNSDTLALIHVQNYFSLVTKAEFAGLQMQVKMLALQIGLRPAARACNLDEWRVLKWSQRGKWGISQVAPCITGTLPKSSNVLTPVESINSVVQHFGDRAKIGATIAGAKALEHLADSEGFKLVAPANAIAADQWTKAVDRAAGWTQARAQGVTVNVANIVPPSDEERTERRRVHAQLDEITKLLGASST